MTSKNSFRKPFTTMFLQSLKKTVFLPAAAFICLLFFTISNFNNFLHVDVRIQSFNGFFWSEINEFYFSTIVVIFALAGLINALVLYNFTWSKKQSNVIFSLGMKRSEIYMSKYLAGVLPMVAAIIIAGFIETASCAYFYTLDWHFWSKAIEIMLMFISVYVLGFSLSAAVFSNSGNAVEALIFTIILALSPTILHSLFESMFGAFTLGAANLPGKWIWGMPFIFDGEDISYYFTVGTEKQNVDFYASYSAPISSLIYAAVSVAAGFFAFLKHRNETGGAWGRSKGLNEICGAIAGVFAFSLVIQGMTSSDGSTGTFLTFLLGFLSFAAVMIIFKFIFGYKRKKELKKTLVYLPAYCAGLVVITVIFSTGLFGYSSYVPELKNVEGVEVNSILWTEEEGGHSRSSYFGLCSQSVSHNYVNTTNFSFFGDDAEKVIKLHKSYIEDGRIKSNRKDACYDAFQVVYTLKNGENVVRRYWATTEKTAKMMLELNDIESKKEILAMTFETAMQKASEVNPFEEGTDEWYQYEQMRSPLQDYYNEDFTKFSNVFVEDCFMFPKDMSEGYNIGKITDGLYKALLEDMKATKSKDYYFHSPEDELGVLCFGFSYTAKPVDRNTTYGDAAVPQTTHLVGDNDYTAEEVYPTPAVGTSGETCWNINSNDIKAFVVRKDMVNTVKYLEEHDLMKHFKAKRDISDIKAVRLAEPSELYGTKHRTEIMPLFYGSFWTGEKMKEYIEIYNSGDGYYTYDFDSINNEITNKKQIEKLFKKSLISGFCGNDSRIMEITYNDGAVSTVFINYNDYEAVMG